MHKHVQELTGNSQKDRMPMIPYHDLSGNTWPSESKRQPLSGIGTAGIAMGKRLTLSSIQVRKKMEVSGAAVPSVSTMDVGAVMSALA
jgi:hypothetical protein